MSNHIYHDKGQYVKKMKIKYTKILYGWNTCMSYKAICQVEKNIMVYPHLPKYGEMEINSQRMWKEVKKSEKKLEKGGKYIQIYSPILIIMENEKKYVNENIYYWLCLLYTKCNCTCIDPPYQEMPTGQSIKPRDNPKSKMQTWYIQTRPPNYNIPYLYYTRSEQKCYLV